MKTNHIIPLNEDQRKSLIGFLESQKEDLDCLLRHLRDDPNCCIPEKLWDLIVVLSPRMASDAEIETADWILNHLAD